MSWEVIPDEEKPKVLDAMHDGRCVACLGVVNRTCPAEHEFYCCGCDDTDCAAVSGTDRAEQ